MSRPLKTRIAEATALVVMARAVPTAETLMRQFGLDDRTARRLVTEEAARRERLL